MEIWQYKVVSIDSLVKKTHDHDIDVYKEDVDMRRENAGKNLEKSLESLGNQGWNLVGHLGEFAVFKKKAG